MLESFKWLLTTSFITPSFPWQWINKPTPHSYREFNPEELTKWLHRSKDVLAEFCVHQSPVRSEVCFCTSTNLSKAAPQNLSSPHLSASSWVAVLGLSRGWKLCCVRFGADRHLWYVGPCGRGMYYISHNALPHWGTPAVGPYIWLVSVKKGA